MKMKQRILLLTVKISHANRTVLRFRKPETVLENIGALSSQSKP